MTTRSDRSSTPPSLGDERDRRSSGRVLIGRSAHPTAPNEATNAPTDQFGPDRPEDCVVVRPFVWDGI
jgi:hypothetical protein